MIPFLKSVALAYTARYADLSEFCFLFPNKRSGTFFLKYLRECNPRRTVLAPEVKTVSEFMSDLSGRVAAPRLDLLFILYEEYRKLLGQEADDGEGVSFDAFRSWGETVAADFSDTDQYLADPAVVFKNVKDFREITSNYLTDDQKEVMEEYFGHSEPGDAGSFWKNFDSGAAGQGEAKKKFIHLWRILLPLFEALGKRLAGEGLATNGGNARLALQALRLKGRDALPYKRVVAVGFNALTTAEHAVFRELQKLGRPDDPDGFADFLWDATGPVLDSEVNSASKFVKAGIARFPAPEWAMHALKQSHTTELPAEIRVETAPSNSAQTKIAGILLRELYEKEGEKVFKDNKVAVVLPDENLLLPMLYSLPQGIGEVNLTMGYSFRLTSVVPFVTLLRRLLANRRQQEGREAYYHKHLRQLLAHPYVHVLESTAKVNELIGRLNDRHMAVMTLEETAGLLPRLGEVLQGFAAVGSPVETVRWLDGVLGTVADALGQKTTGAMKQRLERDHINLYRDSLRRLADLLDEHPAAMKPATVFRLVDSLLAEQSVGFEGEPLTGLQVMGTLETRSLDFEHIFILSANEKVLPRRARTRSFIPDTLRHAYGMPPSNYAEGMFSYYFYRMISRAKSVTIIHDGRTGGDTGGVSRYVLQMRHLFVPEGRMKERKWKFLLAPPVDSDPSVGKTPGVKKLLEAFEQAHGRGGKNLSASALNNYRECGVRFFYQNAMGINPDRLPSEFVDAITAGNVLHDVMKDLYVAGPLRGQYLKAGVRIHKERIESLLADREGLLRMVNRSLNKLHFNLAEEDLDRELPGGAAMVADRIAAQARNILGHDLTLAPFTVHGVEIAEVLRVTLRSGRTVNFRFAIDRLDEVETENGPVLRIVDYKTGAIKLEAEDMEALFKPGYKQEQAFQLFVYNWLLSKRGGVELKGTERLEIYNANAQADKVSNLPRIGEETAGAAGVFAREFDAGIDTMIEGIFKGEKFEAAEKSACTLCGFRDLCRR